MKLKINGKQFDFFNESSVVLKYDSIGSTFSFNLFFNPQNPDHRQILKPFSYNRVEIFDGDELLLTGTALVGGFKKDSLSQLVNVAGYSLPGILDDCEIPTSLWPLQDINVSLKTIAERMIKPFKLKMLISDSVLEKMQRTYKSSTADEKQTIKQYLASKAAQKNIVLSHTPKGELLFTEANIKQAPIIQLDGNIPGLEYTLKVDGQKMHSTITIVKQADDEDENSAKTTINNPYVKEFRPTVRVQSSGDNNTVAETAKAVLSEELKAIELTVKLDRWSVNGKILRPNSVIMVKSEDLFLNKPTMFFVEEVDLKGDEKTQTATLTCFVPEVYSNGTPKNIFE